MGQTKAGGSAPAKSSKTPTKASGGAAKREENREPTSGAEKNFKPIRPRQHRELWLISFLGLAVLFALAALNVKGAFILWLRRLLMGLLGWGAYLAPFAALADMLLVLSARGRPVGHRLVATSLLPFLCSASVHMLLSRIEYTFKHCWLLYENGVQLLSGGFLAGGFAELTVGTLSRVGGIILMLLFLVWDILVIWDLKFVEIVDFFLDWFDMRKAARESRQSEAYSAVYDEVKARPVREQPEVQEMRELPVDKVPLTSRSQQHINSRRLRSENVDLPLDAVAPSRDKALPDFPDFSPGEPQLMRMPDDEPPDERFQSGRDSGRRENVPSEPPAYAKSRWGKEPREFDDFPPWEEPITVESRDAFQNPDESADVLPKQSARKNNTDEAVKVVDTHTQERPVEANLPIITAEDAVKGEIPYQFPPVTLLKEPVNIPSEDATQELRDRSRILSETLTSFGVAAQITGVIRGPSVTRYELQLDRGVKLTRLTSLQNDIALALGATGIRIAPIPDKQAVGIEVPNKVVQIVYMREVLLSQNMSAEKSKLSFALGRDITGESVVADIHKMPHLLIAGTTGSGKSVCINSIIVSLLYRTTPKEVRFIMIDPKMVELRDYDGIPHLLIPVVTDYKKAPGTLAWAVAEMERRYKLMSEAGARELSAYNRMLETNGEETLPRIIIIIDELADLMMVAAKDIEEAICRIAQKARAAGMHLIIATQRPSADVLTGLMKSNIPSRIAFAVASQMESRIILDQGGADKLIGRGDMLFSPLGASKPRRIQGCYLSDGEIEKITSYIKQYNQPDYSQEIIEQIESAGNDVENDMNPDDEGDPMLGDAIDVVMETGQASASMLQRKLKLGYARAARIIDQMESRGIIGPYDGSRPRQILISKMDWQEMKLRYGVRS